MTDETPKHAPREERRQTSVAIYPGDLAWLKTRQLQVSNDSGQWVPMSDIIHGLRVLVEEGRVL